MRNLYLRIHYGCDERFNLVSHTIRVSAPYFYQIRVTNFGPDENNARFAGLLKEFPNLQVVNMGKHYHMCITEDLLRHHYMDVPDGEWVAWLDSDWRFPPYFLDHMQEEIDKCEAEGFSHIFSYQLGHGKGTFNGDIFNQEVIDRNIKRWRDTPGLYGWSVIQKVDKKNLWTAGFCGNHSYALHVPYKKKHIPEMYHLHIRDFSDHAYCSTMTHQSWWYLGHHVFTMPEQEAVYNSWEYNAMEAFKIKHRCFTSNQFHTMKENPEFKEELRKLFVQFKDSKIVSCQQMYRLATQYNMVFLGSDTKDFECDGPCCMYKCGRIYDLPV